MTEKTKIFFSSVCLFINIIVKNTEEEETGKAAVISFVPLATATELLGNI